MGDEGQAHDLGRLGLAPHQGRQLGAHRSQAGLDESQGDRPTQGGREAAGRDPADNFAIGGEHLGALAGRRALDGQADTHAAEAAGQLAEDASGAGNIAGLAPAPGDREAQVGLDRADGLVEVMTVERQARLQAQGIPRPEADRAHPLVGQQPVPEPPGGECRNQDLEAVLACVAGPGHHQLHALPAEAGKAHEAELGRAR